MVPLRYLVALGVACVFAACLRADEPSDDVKRLKGTWVVTSATRDGKTSVEMKGARIAFAGGTMTVQGGDGGEQELPFKVDPAKKPKAIDFPLGGGGGWLNLPATIKGIYRLEGDTLTLCVGSGDNRPAEFRDREATLLVLKRRK